MKPIPLTTPLAGKTEVGGMLGCIVVLMEEDNTDSDAIRRGHEALDSNVRDKLSQVVATLSITKPEPSDEDIEAISDQIGDAVKSAISDGVSVLSWISRSHDERRRSQSRNAEDECAKARGSRPRLRRRHRLRRRCSRRGLR